LLSNARWVSKDDSIEWRLLQGDFATLKFDVPPPDLIFFDPFSFKTDSRLWTVASFLELLQVCNGRATELFTYTYSTAVRAAMLAAGFYVAKGCATGPKEETTIALSPLAARGNHCRELLGAAWLLRWSRSGAQTPFGVSANDESWRAAVTGHPQFQLT
jgi:queuine tRNA-ribosyltransferase